MTNPNVGRAQVPTQQEVKVMNAQDDIANRGLDPSLGGFPNPNGDEKYQRLWLERAGWIVEGHDAFQDPVKADLIGDRRDAQRVDHRTYQEILAGAPPKYGKPVVPSADFIQPGQTWNSQFPAAPPIARVSRPENRAMAHESDNGKARLTVTEHLSGLIRRVIRGAETEPLNPGQNRKEKRRWAAARDAGHEIVDNGVDPADDRSYDARVFSAGKGSYVHLDPNGPPVIEPTKVDDNVKNRKLKFRD